MKIGYPCANLTIGPIKDLFSKEEAEAIAVENLACLARTLEFNEKAGLSFFAISPRLIPHQTLPDLVVEYSECLAAIGAYVKEKGMRIAACPARAALAAERRAADLAHLASLLDAMGLDTTAKIPVRINGRGEAESVAASFCREYDALPEAVTRRLVIRNDRIHTVGDCCAVGQACGVPVAYDHHQAGGDPGEGVRECALTWKSGDGAPIVFYGSLDPGVPHPQSVDPAAFRSFLAATAPAAREIDVMLLFKDRERSALTARRVARDDLRLRGAPLMTVRH
ncbi:UV DNA damage repair endonuclease UvsE [Methanofollis formosanus]|nr:UV DNA damage repair endonuclease UvsE [Methanofollis formosanus]